MAQTVLMLLHGGLLLIFGVMLSAAFAGIQPTRKNALALLDLCAFCGFLQIGVWILFSVDFVWKLYPVITHLPLFLFLLAVYRKPVLTVLACVSTAYLCCQISKFFGVLAFTLTDSPVGEYGARILVLILSAGMVLKYFAPYLSVLFLKDRRSVCIFGALPVVYYCFDYAAVIYSDLWVRNNQIAGEFLAFFLCVSFMVFCILYHKEYEQKADAERMEQIIRITAQQQSKEMEAVRRSEQEIRLLRHDMRLFLNSLSVCIASGEPEQARDMIANYSAVIDQTRVERFCGNDTVNYVLSYFAEKCRSEHIDFRCTIETEEITADEIILSSILSNALDNAINAQLELPEPERRIRLMLKTANGKLLFSIKNPTARRPVFSDGLPVSERKGHGYGTQSIRYMTRRLGGNCQFSVKDDLFILRVIL